MATVEDKHEENIRDLVLRKEKEGMVILRTIEGFSEISIDGILNQPTEGLLSDLNRDRITILTYIKDNPKWVNDYACMLVIEKLSNDLATLKDSYTKEEAEELLKKQRGICAKAYFEKDFKKTSTYADVMEIIENCTTTTIKIKGRKMKDGCTCQSCGNIYKVDFLVSDDVWERIKPENKPKGCGLLCGICIAKALEHLNGFAVLKIENVKRNTAF